MHPIDVSWIFGMYSYRKDVGLLYNDHWEDSWGFYPSVFSSEFSTERLSFYGQVDWMAREKLSLSGGARWETYDNFYLDSAGVNANPADTNNIRGVFVFLVTNGGSYANVPDGNYYTKLRGDGSLLGVKDLTTLKVIKLEDFAKKCLVR
mgnify:CR=1 FL=1